MSHDPNTPHHPRRRVRTSQNWRQFLFVFAAALGVLTGHWTAETWSHWMNHEWFQKPSAAFGFTVTAIFACCPFLLYSLRRAWRRPLSRIPVTETPPQREVLFWFLSELAGPKVGTYVDGVPPWFKPTGDLDADIAALESLKKQNRRWQWEMPLRGLRHHVGRLRTLILIVSDKSAPQAHWLRGLLHRYESLKSAQVKVLVRRKGDPWIGDCPTTASLDATEGWDFEDFNTLAEAVTYALTELNEMGVPGVKEHRLIPDHHIMIDFTGGQKVTSVVAAAVTFNRPVRAQYVSTNPPNAVRGYHLEWADPKAEEFGLAE